MKKGIKQEKLHGVESLDVECPDIGWFRIVLQNDPTYCECYMIGRWIDSDGVTVEDIQKTNLNRAWHSDEETKEFAKKLIAKVKEEIGWVKPFDGGSLKGWRVGDFCRVKDVDKYDIEEKWNGCFTVTGCFAEGRLDVVNNVGLNGNFWPNELVNLSNETE